MLKLIIHLLKLIKHHLWLILLDLEGLKDRYRLYRDFPELKKQFNSPAPLLLKDNYTNYTTNVSDPKMAVSLELAVFLYTLCLVFKPQSILDLGSGYSSFVFTSYKRESERTVKLWSVDDNSKWLTKTRVYLKREKWQPTRFLSWKTLEKMGLSKLPFELILYDLGTMSTRKRFFHYLLKHARKGTIIIVDDMHMLDYQRLVRKLVNEEEVQFYSLKSFTKDSYHRFATLLIR